MISLTTTTLSAQPAEDSEKTHTKSQATRCLGCLFILATKDPPANAQNATLSSL